MPSKGAGAGGCCCNGCHGVPNDNREGAGALQNVLAIQQYCCRCVPRYLCVTVDESSFMIGRNCSTADYSGDAIIFTGSIRIGTSSYTINVRLGVLYEVCYLSWDIPDLEYSDSKAITHETPADPYVCNDGMASDDCGAGFGGTWEMPNGMQLTISKTDALPIKDAIDCSGCDCICKCMCVSIYSKDTSGSYTVVAQNEVVCGLIVEEVDSYEGPNIKYALWEITGGWKIAIGGQSRWPPHTCVITSGTQTIPAYPLYSVLQFNDELYHVLSGTVDAEYQFGIDYRKPYWLQWVGYLQDETKTATLTIWNWLSSSWDDLFTITGQSSTIDVRRIKRVQLDPDAHVGTGADEGKVKVRVQMPDGGELHSTRLILETDQCCRASLTVPPEVPADPPPEIQLTGSHACPNPRLFWNFTDDDGVEWTVTTDCAWCNSQCGSVSTTCCERPVPNTLFAEITIDCTCAPTTFVIPLYATTGSIWDGEGTMCGSPFTVTLSCGSGGWHIRVEGAGACSFEDDAFMPECEPLYLSWAGSYAGGLGCCGPSDLPHISGTTISIVVVE